MLKKYGDLIAGISVAAIGLIIFIASGSIAQKDSKIGADFLPRIVSAVLFILGCALALRGARSAKAFSNDEGDAAKPAYLTMLASLALMIAYAALLSRVGFIITSAVYLFLQILLISRKEEIHYIKIAVISLCAPIAIFLLFVNVFGIMIPPGILG